MKDIGKAIAYFDSNSSINNVSGTIEMVQETINSPTMFVIDLEKFPKNSTHAMHIHEFGNLTEGCHSTGGHYNPHGEKHGSRYIHGVKRHVGDLINNIESDGHGKVKICFEDPLVKLSGKYSVIGRALVIHYSVDDLGVGGLDDKGYVVNEKEHRESIKTGNAGGRMSCAIIGINS